MTQEILGRGVAGIGVASRTFSGVNSKPAGKTGKRQSRTGTEVKLA
jgi:hypothetical protein